MMKTLNEFESLFLSDARRYLDDNEYDNYKSGG